MFKFAAIFATLCLVACTSAGHIETHHVVHEPAVAKVGHVVHSAPSAVSHQSITQVHQSKHIVEPVYAPVVKTTVHHAAPVHHVASVHHVAPVHTPVVHAVHSAPSVHHTVHHAAPVVHSVHHSAPVVHTVHHNSAPLVHSLHHH